MARLTAAQRRKLPASAFAYPKQRKYPIMDRAHARAALALSARKSTFGSYATVARKVAARHPGIAVAGRKRRSR